MTTYEKIKFAISTISTEKLEKLLNMFEEKDKKVYRLISNELCFVRGLEKYNIFNK